MTTTIYHNPKCATSRKVLALIRLHGVEPEVVDYQKTPLSRDQLVALLGRLQARPRDILRLKGTPYAELGLDDPGLGDDRLIDAMVSHPILLERPIVIADKGAALCRPPEKVLELLP
ncbi:MAG: arsenate reductase (glutaredoxin) [Ancalomicrobiaceae bacterium]|nr:arsenate reductase (glutaredoxin) [Ancalomicrobiaceae bacterium]